MNKVRTAIIGLGNIAHGYDDIPEVIRRMRYPTHVSVLRQDRRFKLVAGSDTSAKAGKAFAAKVSPAVCVYKDYREMITTEQPVLVVVATPTATHVKICKGIIALGVKNILCEKPFSYSVREAKSLLAIAKKKKVKLAFNYFRVYDKGYQTLIQSIKTGKFGKIKSIEVKYYKGIYNTATHLINLLEKMFGPVRTVKATGGVSGGTDPNINFQARFKDVVADVISYAGSKPVLEVRMTFVDKKINITRDTSKDVSLNINTSMLDVYDNIYEFIAGRKPASCSAEEALQTLKVADAAVCSLASGREVKV